MNYLNNNPNLIENKIYCKRRNYSYICLNLLTDLDIPIHIYYEYFISIEEFKLKNIWNHIIIKWNHMMLDLNNNKEFLKSNYSKDKYNQVHEDIDDNKFNELLINFIDNNILKSLFVCNSIYNYIYPN